VTEPLIPIPWDAAPTPCRGCGEEIYFVTDARTRRPHPVSVACTRCRPPAREQVERDPATGTEHVLAERRDGRGVSHFANCPAADRFRR
jgi:hypothetical protein